MDKYTVDLDQVLNDFEYSELTDHHEVSDGGARPNKHKPQPPSNIAAKSNATSNHYLHNNLKNSNVKHSINNVFHSLNEYLNSEITAKVPNDIRNREEGTSLLDQPVEPIPEKPPEEPNLTKFVAEEEENSENEGQCDEECTEICNNPSAEEFSIEEEEEPKTVVGSEEPKFNNEIIQDALVDVEEKTVVAVGDNEEPDNSEERYASAESVEVIPIEEPIEKNVIPTENLLEAEKPQEESIEVLKPPEVGFDDLDLDDSELNQYLDDLEKEFESQELEKEEISNKSLGEELAESLTADKETVLLQSEENKTSEDDIEIIEEPPEKEEESNNEKLIEKDEEDTDEASKTTVNSRPNNLLLPVKEMSNITKPVIDLVGNPGSTPYNNVYINKELPKSRNVKNENNSDTECSTSASPTFSDVSTETTSSMTPSTDTVNDDNNETKSTNKKTEDKEDVIVITKDTEEEGTDEEKGGTSSSSLVTDVNSPSINVEESQIIEEPTVTMDTTVENQQSLGKEAPLWIPDADATNCLHCEMKFTVLKRRHHCRACGYVLCAKCCNLRHRLDYLEDVARVCNRCHDVLTARDTASSSGDSEQNSPRSLPQQQPNPNRPLEYCSTVPPHQQVGEYTAPPAVMVPVGVLKRKGSNKGRSNKSVMFCDGIRPGSDLTILDTDFGYKNDSRKEVITKKTSEVETTAPVKLVPRNYPTIDSDTRSYIPTGDALPPTVTINKTDMSFSDCKNTEDVVNLMRTEVVTFALQLNLTVHVSIIDMDCCINKLAWCFATEGMINVGQDEIVILLELLDDERTVPKDVFLHLNNIWSDAVKGTSVKEMGLSLHNTSNFLGSKNHAGFLFIRPTFQCLQNVIKPAEPYLIGILIHRWETPWAKLFPLRLILRLGAEYRYYPSPIISNRYRDSVFVEIGHTIINLLADFRNFSYTLPQIRGLTIHMEDKNTTVTIPSNRYDQVMKSMNNSSDHILAFAGNFSSLADSHLVCIQDTQSTENAYSTHAINIHNKPRKVTGASFLVLNGALKSSSGLTAKSSIVEDGLMIQIPAEHMVQVRDKLRNMKDHTIQCGCVNATSDETVNIVWGEPDVNFNVNVTSPIDAQSMGGVPSIRVHNGRDYVCTNGGRIIRWTEVFIIQNADESGRNQDPVDISKVSESIAKATCTALVKYLDLLVSNNFYKIGIRTTLDVENVSYSAGSNATKLPPIYMKSLDNELIPVLHRITSNNFSENAIILELIFRILNK